MALGFISLVSEGFWMGDYGGGGGRVGAPEEKGSARGSVHCGSLCDDATAVGIKADPQRRRLAAASPTLLFSP
jgi:hypothetical protein